MKKKTLDIIVEVVDELKNIIKQASSMVPPPMKQMLPQNMQNVMKEVDQ